MISLNDPSLIKSQCLVGNGWCGSDDGQVLQVNNPFNDEHIADVPILSAVEIQCAIDSSAAAQSIWANDYTAGQRASLLNQWADLAEKNIEDLATIMVVESGKPMKEALGEIAYANSFLRWFAEEGKRIYGDTIPAKSTDLRYITLKQPVGVCAAITPWNFPTAMIARKVAPALASGCSMIIKPDEHTPLSAFAYAEMAIRAGIPSGVIQVVTGDPKVIGKVLCDSTIVRKLSFTGSTDVGKLLMQQCAPTLKKVSLELGGNAPFIIFDDADINQAVDGLIASKYRNAGQTCICANRIFVHDAIKADFVKLLVEKLNNLKVGDGIDEHTDIGPMINQAAIEKVQRLQKDALEKGASCLLGGELHESSLLCYQPTVLAGVTTAMDIAHEEIFGPIAAIQSFADEKDVIARANATQAGLAAYFYTNNYARAWRVTEKLAYGMVGHNTGLISNEVAPFGGIKESGFGREGSKYGIEEYLDIKYWCSAI